MLIEVNFALFRFLHLFFPGFNVGLDIRNVRIHLLLRLQATLLITMGTLAVFSLCVFLGAEPMVRFFRDDAAVLAIGVPALRYICFTMVLMPFSVLTNVTLQSSGKALPASFLALLRSGVYFIPLLLWLNATRGILGIELAQPIADVLTSLTSIPFVMHYFRSLPKERPKD